MVELNQGRNWSAIYKLVKVGQFLALVIIFLWILDAIFN
jgi:hypothetical protein